MCVYFLYKYKRSEYTLSQKPENTPSSAWVELLLLNVSILIAVLLAVTIAHSIFNGFTIIPSGHKGVLIDKKEVQNNILEEGFHLKNPFNQRVVNMDIQLKNIETETTTPTKDLQTVLTKITVDYKLNPKEVNKIFKEAGQDYEQKILNPAIEEALKSVTTRYKSDELVSKREEVSQNIKEALAERMTEHHIILTEINITNFYFSEPLSIMID